MQHSVFGKRLFLKSGLAIGLSCSLTHANAEDEWGKDQDYPIGWGPQGLPQRWEAYPAYRVGNYSGGFERMFLHNRIQAPKEPAPLTVKPVEIKYGPFGSKTPHDYMNSWPITSLLIARDGKILFESYRMDRTPSMRMTSWSMAKSVTSLLVGIALDKGLIRSLDDLPESYATQLKGTLHGGIPIRHLLNMSSGVDVVHERDPIRIDVPALLGYQQRATNTDVERVVITWSDKLEAPGIRFNYNELCPLTIGMVLRSATGMKLAEWAQQVLWQPMGAEAMATWLTDSLGKEYNCVGFAACTHDWARLGQLIAQNGYMNRRQVISQQWIDQCSSWGPADQQVSWGKARRDGGYKNFFWHPKSDGSWMVMNGHHGQRIAIDRISRTVMVQTAVGPQGRWNDEFFEIFKVATRLS
jgi:CubicO group peptidase (beta-lactamase class C family)